MTQRNEQENARPMRRVGTLTMGVAMIAVGAALLCWLFGWLNDQQFFQLCRLSPLLLVGVGVELCVFGAAGDRVQLRYDIVSVIFCGLLLCCSLGLSMLAVVLQRLVLPD